VEGAESTKQAAFKIAADELKTRIFDLLALVEKEAR
jgi:hypothetical protein